MDTGVPKDKYLYSWKMDDVLALTASSARRAGHFNAQDILC